MKIKIGDRVQSDIDPRYIGTVIDIRSGMGPKGKLAKVRWDSAETEIDTSHLKKLPP